MQPFRWSDGILRCKLILFLLKVDQDVEIFRHLSLPVCLINAWPLSRPSQFLPLSPLPPLWKVRNRSRRTSTICSCWTSKQPASNMKKFSLSRFLLFFLNKRISLNSCFSGDYWISGYRYKHWWLEGDRGLSPVRQTHGQPNSNALLHLAYRNYSGTKIELVSKAFYTLIIIIF